MLGTNFWVVPVCLTLAITIAANGQDRAFRPPSVPLVACDPYFSIWSPADHLTDRPTVHWTGKRQSLSSMVRIDGKPCRLMGTDPADVPAMEQASIKVEPTRTVYRFSSPEVAIVLTFLTPALPDDLEVMSWPLTYITWEATSRDGKQHAIQIYIDASAELAVNTPDQQVQWESPRIAGLAAMRIGSVEQNILGKRGDDLRIDWGYAYLAAPAGNVETLSGEGREVRSAFAANRPVVQPDAVDQPRPVGDQPPVMALLMDLGQVGQTPVSRFAMLAYDDLYSIQYMKQNLRPYWRRNGAEAADLLTKAAAAYPSLDQRCRAFDAALVRDLTAAGGAQYAQICALAYRQCLAANKIAADANGQPLLFPKENFSNGCIATVDVIYPMLPQFLLLNPALAKASLVPVLDYAASPRWKFPFAPHDLGTYPMANGQVYGGGERTEENQMPVEESGNMLILLAAIARIDGNADFAKKYEPQLARWAEYLKSKGFDPENQLCTDDFAGHLAHNVNLSAKAIVGLGAYAQLCQMMGKAQEAAEYRKVAEDFAARWVREADDGEKYRLAFDRPGTWSQKYNIVWDRILGLKLFPEEVVRKEMAYYRKIQNRFGLPLDNRRTYTKLDWITWTATLSGSPEDFEALVSPVYAFLNQTPNRVPMTDWYDTISARRSGFQARSVVGGVFIKMLDDPQVWKKWAGKSASVKGNWAPLPVPPEMKVVVPTAQNAQIPWRYTMERPAENWFSADFDDSHWQQGTGGFGTSGTPGSIVKTQWSTPDIWMRRTFELDPSSLKEPQLRIHHDEDAEVYINGVLAATLRGYSTDYQEVRLSQPARKALKPGRNILAVHCHQTGGGQYIDVGIVDVK